MKLTAEAIKRMDMVDILTLYYGLSFTRKGEGHVCLSPFTDEKEASFFVREVDGHWLYKDFSGDSSGTMIDFVMHKEGLNSPNEAIVYLSNLLDQDGVGCPVSPSKPIGPSYDVDYIYRKLQSNDISVCKEYLSNRGISQEVIEELCSRGLVLHNLKHDRSYCCFVVYNSHGVLQCLDNHEIGGSNKFVLGKKHSFSLDWSELCEAESVFVCEGIIDYLSMKVLEGMDMYGIALLGKEVGMIDPALFSKARVVLSCLDTDKAGFSAYLDLQALFSDKECSVFKTGSHEDPNEYLQSLRDGNPTKAFLSSKEKRRIYEEYTQSSNKSTVAARWGINRSYMYQIVRECQEMIDEGYNNRRVGRVRKNKPQTLQEAMDRIASLESEKEEIIHEKEKLWATGEFMKVRLKWSEIENAELRGEKVDPIKEKPSRKRQIKKKKKKRY